MAAKRENCVLVVDDDDTVCGIFTAKDLAFRVVGCQLDSKSVTIEQIMTRNPMCARTDTSATEALNLMVSKGFRHLPIMDENQDIAGVLDITKCFHEAMEKLNRAYNSSRKIYDALEGAQLDANGNINSASTAKAAQIIQYVEALKQQMEGPDLTSVLDETTTPVFVSIKTNATEAAKLMKERNTTAVLVTDNNHITGIVTSKDIVLRVIAAGFNPSICSLVRVMTPQPDFAPQTLTIQDALRKMYEGNYLNLPIMGDNNEVVGIVDVLTLTYATLEQMNSINENSTSSNNIASVGIDGGNGGGDAAEFVEGPAWNKFWMSIDDDHSIHSDHSGYTRSVTPGGLSQHSNSNSRRKMLDDGSIPPEISASELAQFNIDNVELGPNDSVSHSGFEDDGNNMSLNQVMMENAGAGVPSAAAASSVMTGSNFAGASSNLDSNNMHLSVTYPFKFKTPSGRVHRITVSPDEGIEILRQEILYKLKPEELASLGGEGQVSDGKLISSGFGISYLDDEGDVIAITSDKDLVDAILINKSLGKNKAELFIHHPDQHQDLIPASSASTTTNTAGKKQKKTAGGGASGKRRAGVGKRKLRLSLNGQDQEIKYDDEDEDDEEDGTELSGGSRPIIASSADQTSDSEEEDDSDDYDSDKKKITSRKKGSARRGKTGGGAFGLGDEPLIPGIPNDLILPGALVTLAASIIVVFALSRNRR